MTMFDPLDPAFLADPYPGYAWLRDNDPVHHRERDHRAPGFWALSRFEHIWDAVRRPEVFSSASGLTFFRDEIDQLGLPPTIVMLDPPVQTRLRALIGRGFTPRHVTRLEDTIRSFVRRQIAEMTRRSADGEPVDLHTEFSSAVPDVRAGRAVRPAGGRPGAVRPVGADPDAPAERGIRRQRAGRRHQRRPRRAGGCAGDRRDVRVLHGSHHRGSTGPGRRPARSARHRRDRRRAAQRLGHPRLLLRGHCRWRRHHGQPDLAHRPAHRAGDGAARAAAGRPLADPGRTRGVPALRVLRAGPGAHHDDGRGGRRGRDPCRREGADALRLGEPRPSGVRRDGRPARRTPSRSGATWPSAAVRTSASAATSRGSRRGSRSRSCSPPTRTSPSTPRRASGTSPRSCAGGSRSRRSGSASSSTC